MSQMSDYLEDQLRKHVFRTGAFSKPGNLYVSLHTSNPLDTGAGTEVSGGSYARVAHGPSDATWSAGTATNGTTQNVGAITFPAPTSSWGTVTHFGIWDAISGGNLICYGALTTPKTINGGDAAPSFADSALSVVFA